MTNDKRLIEDCQPSVVISVEASREKLENVLGPEKMPNDQTRSRRGD